MNCPTCLHDDEQRVTLKPYTDALRCPRCEGTFDERGEHFHAASPTTLRTRRHRERKRIELALACAELVRALPDVAAIAQAMAAEFSPTELSRLKRRLTVEHEIATHKATLADARQTLLELGVPVPDVGNGPAPDMELGAVSPEGNGPPPPRRKREPEEEGYTCQQCQVACRFDPDCVGDTVGGLTLRGWWWCDPCGLGYLSRAGVETTAGDWRLTKHGFSIDAGSFRIRLEGRGPEDGRRELLDRLLRLPELERLAGAGGGGCQPPAASRAHKPGGSPHRAQKAQGTDRLNGAPAAGRHGGA